MTALQEGVVSALFPSACSVIVGGQTLRCGFPGPDFRRPSAKKRNPRSGVCGADPILPAVGDRVRIERIGSDAGRIVELIPSTNRISRAVSDSSRGHPIRQVLAANIDQIAAFCAVDHPPPEWHLLDRFLVLAERSGIPAVILLSKSDLSPQSGSAASELAAEAQEYRRIGYRVTGCSVKTGLGIEEIRTMLRNRTTLLLGKSGAGKSSLLNALYPEWNLRVSGVSRFGEGRCTTPNAVLFRLPCGGAVVDTPGIRRFELWDEGESNPADGFREMRDCIGHCRFGAGCRHGEEPGCAVRRAVEAGRVSPRRFRSMIRLAGDSS